MLTLALAPGSLNAQTFQTGDIFVATHDFDPLSPDGFLGQTGKVKWFRLNTATGAFELVKELDTTVGGEPTGMAFDKAGNLYVTNFIDAASPNPFLLSGSISKFDNAGNLLGKFAGTPDRTRFVHPESLAFDGVGNIFVGDADNRVNPQIFPSPAILTKLDPNGITLATYELATDDRGTDWIDLSKDQNTILYTSEGKRVFSFDTSTNTQNPDFASGLPGDSAFALRIAPSGEVFVADSDEVVRLSSSGTIVQTYFVPPCPGCTPQSLFALNLDPDGLHLWTADLFGGPVSRVRIDTGAVDATIDTLLSACCGFIGGVAIFGEHTAGTGGTTGTQDATPPVVLCGTPDGLWHATDVSIACTASDSGSGLASPADASFFLTTSVASGTETANASTNTRAVCDKAGNCATAGPIAGNRIDKKAPSITITSPTSTNFTINASVLASYTCIDAGSGVALCSGPVASGASLNTTQAGAFTFLVNAADAVGNASSQSVAYNVTYGVCLLYDPTKAKHSGSTIPLKLFLCDGAGHNVSSSAVVVSAVSLTTVLTSALLPIDDAGSANANDLNFRFSADLIAGGGYIFNLNTSGLGTGTFKLTFRAGNDPVLHDLFFQLQ